MNYLATHRTSPRDLLNLVCAESRASDADPELTFIEDQGDSSGNPIPPYKKRASRIHATIKCSH